VADCGDAELFQILGGQLRQYPQVDLVLAKRLFVSLKPELAQPAPNVHRVRSGARLRRIVRTKDNAREPMMRPK
jgi:hypothetical protein